MTDHSNPLYHTMKRLLLTVLAILGLAATTARAADLSLSASAPYVTHYVFRGVQVGDQAAQPEVNLSYGGLYASAFASLPNSPDEARELDFGAGYTRDIGPLSLDLGATNYHYPEADRSAGELRNTVEGYAGVGFTLLGLEAGLTGYRDFDLRTTTLEAKLGREITLGKRATLGLALVAGQVRGGGVTYRYWEPAADLTLALCSRASLTLGARYSDHDLSDVPGKRVWGTVGVSLDL